MVHHVHRTARGDIGAVCAGTAPTPWSPRPIEGVHDDLRGGDVRYVVSWLGAERPVVALPRPDGGRHLHSTHPSGAGNALDSLPDCPVHTDAPRSRRTIHDDAVLAACRAHHPSIWPPRLVPPG